MAEAKELADLYLTLGAGGLILIVSIGIVIYAVLKLRPILEQIRADNKVNTEVIKNVTSAVREMSRSNDNVANALALLNNSIKNFDKSLLAQNNLLLKHDERAKDIETDMAILYETVKNQKGDA